MKYSTGVSILCEWVLSIKLIILDVNQMNQFMVKRNRYATFLSPVVVNNTQNRALGSLSTQLNMRYIVNNSYCFTPPYNKSVETSR